jgi:hypothetical protein
MMARQKGLENPPAYRRQAFLACSADRFSMGDRVVRTAPVIVIGFGKCQVRGRFSGH